MKKKIDPVDLYLGQNLRQIRLKKELTIEELAQKLEIEERLLREFERGESRLKAAMLWKMAFVLRTPVSRFYRGIKHA